MEKNFKKVKRSCSLNRYYRVAYLFLTFFSLLLLDASGPVEVSQNVKYVCETDGQVTNTGKFEKLILCENTGSFSTVPSELPICRDAIECGLPPTPPDANKLQYATGGPDTSGCQFDDCVLTLLKSGNLQYKYAGLLGRWDK